MPGYILVEESAMARYRDGGIEPVSEEPIGFLDFLRELAQDELPFSKYTQLVVVGLEEALFATQEGQEEREIALDIRRRLKHAASDLEQRLITTQVVLKGRLVRGDTLWLEYRGRRLRLDLIFGSPILQTDSHGNKFYSVKFSLTNGG
ncbi:MAG TPA: hypothetical protein VFD30_21905 [Terriglobia bacterium]|nr:hypothetical protein [Terriglobia bacterium]